MLLILLSKNAKDALLMLVNLYDAELYATRRIRSANKLAVSVWPCQLVRHQLSPHKDSIAPVDDLLELFGMIAAVSCPAALSSCHQGKSLPLTS